MTKNNLLPLFVVAFGLSIAASSATAQTESKPVKGTHVVAQLLSDRDAIVPGGDLNLIVSLKMDPGWHVYWRSPGEAPGLPTSFTWELPEGFKAGRTLYPIPENYFNKELNESSLCHSGTACFITPIKAPDAPSNKEVTFKVKVDWLVCKESCLPGEASVSLTVPIVEKDAKPKSANEKFFEKAKAALPLTPNGSKFVKLSHANIRPVKPGAEFTAKLIVDIKAGHHIQSNKPLQKDLVPAKLFMESTPDFEFGSIAFPKAHERSDSVLGKLSEFTGKIEISIPVKVDPKADKSPRWIRGLLQHQVCSDAGTCFPPDHIEIAIPVQMEGGPTPVSNDEPITSLAVGTTPSLSTAPDPASADASVASDGFLARAEKWLLKFGFWGAFVLAMIGGLVLNLMPCVLPVISLKVLSFVRQSHEDRARIFLLGTMYCAGILTFFGFIAVLYVVNGDGWGSLFQRPQVVLALSAIVMAFALSLFGVFAVFTPQVISDLGAKAEGEGPGSAFATGLLATFLGTACTAPFLSAAVGAASRFPPTQGALIFFAVGLGMALPFFLLSAKPAWLRFVPKPGPWMETFERVMGFLLLGTVIWLMNPLRGQLGDFGLLLTLIFLLFVSLAVWVKGRIQFGDPPGRKIRLYSLFVALIVFGWVLPFRWISTVDRLSADASHRRKLINDGKLYALLGKDAKVKWNPDWSKGMPWLAYDESLIERFVDEGYPIFVDFTATWCLNCKLNLHSSIDVESTRKVMQELNVIPFEADFSNKDPVLKAAMARQGKPGVPVYLVYKPGNLEQPEVLPEILTPQIVIDALRRAGPSKAKPAEVEAGATASAAPLEKRP